MGSEGPKAGFVLDLGRCTGCSACVLACRLENVDRSSSPLRRVLALNEARHAAGPTWFLSVACHHCERPACVRACPSGAYQRRPNGVVALDAALCLGCRYCEMACPFGALRFEATTGTMAKCDFCEARMEAGQPPACVAACPTDALQVLSGSGLNSPLAKPCDAPVTGDWSPERVVPGFADPAACRPAIRFRLPRGIRGRRLQEFTARDEGPTTGDRGRATNDQRPGTSDQRPTTNDQRPCAEWPLVVFTALAIPAAGVFAARLVAEVAPGTASPGNGVFAGALVALAAGLAASLAHLGRPLRAPLALRRAGRNALSTEVALASALVALALLALMPSPSPALRLAFIRGAGVLALSLLAALGLVYFLPARWPWRTSLVATPMTAGLAVGAIVLAAAESPGFRIAALGLLSLDVLAFAASWRGGLPSWVPSYPAIFARRRAIVALRVLLVDVLPAALLVAHLPLAAAMIALPGLFVDRFAFYGLAAVQSTEAAIAEAERSIAGG